jgi:hypothetical protein
MRRTRSLASLASIAALFCCSATTYADTWPTLSAAPLVQGDASRDAALIVGVDEYAFVPHVEGAAANARDWFTFFVAGEKIPIAKTHLLLNRDGTREGILATARKAAGEVAPGGRLWVIFIGHGAPAADGKDGVLVGVDAQQSASGLYARSVGQREILDAVSGGPQASTLLVVDACFSGRTGTGAPLAPGLQPLIRVKEAAPPKAARTETAILSAGTSDQFAGPLPGLGRPAFSYLVLGALRGWGDRNGKGEVTAQDAVDYARLVLSVIPLGRSQTPELTSSSSRVVMSRGAAEKGPELSRIAVTEPPPPTPSARGDVARAPGVAGHVRVRATCAHSPKILAGRAELVVEEIGDSADRALAPASAMVPELRYDEASHKRLMMDPDFVDYDLPPGVHRLRVRAKRCKAFEGRIELDAGATVELSPHLEEYVVPLVSVAFERPSFADASDMMTIRDSDGKALCQNVPCAVTVPVIDQHYYVEWVRGSRTTTIPVPDAGEEAEKKALEGRVLRSTSVGYLAPATAGLGALTAGIGLLMFANNQGPNVPGIDRESNRQTGAIIAASGGAVILGAGLMVLAGVGRQERFSVSLVENERRSDDVSLHLVPGGLVGAF